MPESYLVAFFTLVVLIFMAGTFWFFYLRSLREDLKEYWAVALDDLHLRLDKIPNLIETIIPLTQGQENMMVELVHLRSKSWPMKEPVKEKVHKELEISHKLHTVWGLTKQFPELNKNVNFLALKTEFKEAHIEIEKSVDTYNQKVRSYNKSAKFFLFRIFSLLFGFRKMPIFEFEP